MANYGHMPLDPKYLIHSLKNLNPRQLQYFQNKARHELNQALLQKVKSDGELMAKYRSVQVQQEQLQQRKFEATIWSVNRSVCYYEAYSNELDLMRIWREAINRGLMNNPLHQIINNFKRLPFDDEDFESESQPSSSGSSPVNHFRNVESAKQYYLTEERFKRRLQVLDRADEDIKRIDEMQRIEAHRMETQRRFAEQLRRDVNLQHQLTSTPYQQPKHQARSRIGSGRFLRRKPF